MSGHTALIDIDGLDACLACNEPALESFKTALKQLRAEIQTRFRTGDTATTLVQAHAAAIDQLLVRVWRHFELDHDTGLVLVAVGGYGRGELYPHSDIDLMVLHAGTGDEQLRERIGGFVTFLFDMTLDVGHSVRSVVECMDESTADVTVATNLLEARRLDGSAELFEQMRAAIGPDRIWPSQQFLDAKLAEQRDRHRRFNDTVHNLEPNIKDGPGGLRDLEVIGWVAKRHFGASTLHELVEYQFLTAAELDVLLECQALLGRIRFALHLLAGRGEDRLLFDHQRVLAVDFGYRDQDHRLAVEQFMKAYYRTSTELSRLNEMLLGLFEEALTASDSQDEITTVNERFAIRNGYLEVSHDNVFADTPLALFELFSIAQRNPGIKGVRAATIRLVRAHRHLINDEFRADPQACELFIDIMTQPRGITHELRRMHRYGLLGLYLPLFGDVEGQMQHDLFHAYTVDQHSLFVVGNLRGFAVPERADEFPLCSAIIRRLAKPELLYLAGLFHDIAKGRGGDHSQLGATDAREFCEHHGMSTYDANFVAWLVEHHLLMSATAQRKDISDPDVINEFAAAVGNPQHLDMLYLLTVADIRATHPNLWNDWKDALLKDLYNSSVRALRRGLENPVGKAELVKESLLEARRLLDGHGLDRARVDQLWQELGENYLLRAAPDEIAWHTGAILGNTGEQLPLVLLRPGRGGTELFVYTHDQRGLFASVASTLDRHGLNILDARIITTEDGMTLDSFVVAEANGEPITAAREAEVRKALAVQTRTPLQTQRSTRRLRQRRLEYFRIPTRVSFEADHANQRTIMEVVTNDRPGLLALIGWVLVDAEVNLQNAKIATFGERAEDMFYITDGAHHALDDQQCQQLRERVLSTLEDDDRDTMPPSAMDEQPRPS